MAQLVDSATARLKLYVVRHLKRTNGRFIRGKFIATYRAKTAKEAAQCAVKEFKVKYPLAVIDMSGFVRWLAHEVHFFELWTFEREGVVKRIIMDDLVTVYDRIVPVSKMRVKAG